MTTSSRWSWTSTPRPASASPSPPAGTAALLTPGDRVRLARENLGLAIGVYAASHRGLISPTLAPARLELTRRDGRPFDLDLPLVVSDQRSLLRATGNQVRAAFILAALQTQGEAERVFGPVGDAPAPAPDHPDASLWTARCAAGLIAASVGADPMAPAWRIPPAFRCRHAIPALNFALDATELDGREVRWGHFGGLPRYLDLTLFLSYCLDGIDAATALPAALGRHGAIDAMALRPSRQAPPASPVGDAGGYGSGSGRPARRGGQPDGINGAETAAAGWVAPEGPPEPAFAVASQATEHGPIDAFVASACATASQAMTLAGELYTAYARWCLDQGYLAHSQRKFGLELRALGYERKRRGKGRHWWIGVAPRLMHRDERDARANLQG